jgi:hypothetical protein
MAETSIPAGRWTIDVEAGPHARRNIPGWLTLPSELNLDPDALPWLDRVGRQRTIPCQIERSGNASKLWWIIGEMEPGEIDRYHLSFDRRERSSPIRWRVHKTPTGWSITEQDLRVLDVLAPRHRPASVLLSGPAGPLARLGALGLMPQAGNRPHRRLPSSEPIEQKGPVFAHLQISQDVRGDEDLLLLREELSIRTFPGHKGTRVIDVEVGWHAPARPVPLSMDPASDVPVWPTLRFEWEKDLESVRAAGGRLGVGELDGQSLEWIDVEQGMVRLVALVRQGDLGLPMTWKTQGARTIDLFPRPGLGSEYRWAVGDRCRFGLRLVILPTIGRTMDDVMGLGLDPMCRWTSEPR